MIKFEDISQYINSLKPIENHLNTSFNQLYRPYVYQKKEKLIEDFNNQKSHNFENWILEENDKDNNEIVLVEKNFEVYKKVFTLSLTQKKITINDTVYIEKDILKDEIKIVYYFNLKTLSYGFYIVYIKQNQEISFNKTKGYNSYFYKSDAFLQQIPEKNKELFNQTLLLYDFCSYDFCKINKIDLIPLLFDFVFNKKQINQELIEKILIINDINIENIFDKIYILDIPENFYA